MTDEVFNISGLVDVSVPSQVERITQRFEKELIAGSSPTASGTIQILMSPTPRGFHEPERLLGTTGGALADGSFVCADGRGHFARVDFDGLHVGMDHIEIVLCCSRFSAAVLLEWVVLPIAFFFYAEEVCPLHASGVSVGGRTYVFSAWSGVGKTDLLLRKLYSDPEAVYLGDDAVLVGGEGTVIPSSRTVSVYGYNSSFIPALGRRRAKMTIGRGIKRVGEFQRWRTGRLGQAAAYVGNAFSNVRLDLGRASVLDDLRTRSTDVHFLCHAAAGERAERSSPKADRAELVDPHVAVLAYEHVNFRRFLQGWQWLVEGTPDPWPELESAWREVLNGYFARVPEVSVLSLPRHHTLEVIDAAWGLIVEPSG